MADNINVFKLYKEKDCSTITHACSPKGRTNDKCELGTHLKRHENCLQGVSFGTFLYLKFCYLFLLRFFY